MIIKKLELENFQVIKNFKADFEGNIYFITGDNELGKSTILKAIGSLLTGERDSVLKEGEEKGRAFMIVGADGKDYEIELRYTKANPKGSFIIKQKESGLKTSNISTLSKIFGYNDFDAVEFSRWSETAEGKRKQIEVVKNLMPKEILNKINELDQKIIDNKEKRTEINRDIKVYKNIVEESQKEISGYDVSKYQTINIDSLLKELELFKEKSQKVNEVSLKLKERETQLQEIPISIERIKTNQKNSLDKIENDIQIEIEAHEIKLKKLREEKERIINSTKEEIDKLDERSLDLEKRKNNAQKWLDDHQFIKEKIDDLQTKIFKSQENNTICSKIEKYKKKKSELNNKIQSAEQIEKEISEYQETRKDLIKQAKLPIENLSFDDEGLKLNNLPFIPGVVSDSQIMEVATKLIIASNPNVKVFRIARGESLGEKRLKAIIEIAKKNGFQGFIEEVKRGQDELIIEEYEERQ